MGTAGSVEMKIKDELKNVDKEKRITSIRKHNSQPSNVLPSDKLKNKNENGVRQSQSLFSIDTDSSSPGAANLQVQVATRKETVLKITKEQEILALQRKEQKLETENSRLRAELQAVNRRCQKLRSERDMATESCHEATQRAISLDQDRDKIQRQFKMFRETKESEIQALLQEKRMLESRLHRMQAHGVATGDDHYFVSSVEAMKERPIPDSTTPLNHWWGDAESETMSLFGSYMHIRNVEDSESVTDLQNIDDAHMNDDMLSNSQWQMTSRYQEKNNLQNEYAHSENFEQKAQMRCYVTGTPDCHDEVKALLNSVALKAIQDRCASEGCFLSVFSLESLNVKSSNTPTSSCVQSISVDDIVNHAIQISSLVICFLGCEIGRFTELECHLTDSANFSAYYVVKEGKHENKSAKSEVCHALRSAIKKTSNFKSYSSRSEGIMSAITEITRMVQQGLCVETRPDTREVGSINEIELDKNFLHEQREISVLKKDDIEPVDFQKYYEKLNDHVSSPGPSPPLLISGGCGSGKTTLIKSWLRCLYDINQTFLIFGHYVTSEKATSADPVVVMRRILFEIIAKLPLSHAPPSLAISSYDVTRLRTILPHWLERLSTAKNIRVVLAIDSVDRIRDFSEHFKWFLDPLPLGVRVVISVTPNSCPDIWRQWPTLHLEPLSYPNIRSIITDVTKSRNLQSSMMNVNEVIAHCKTASSCHPLYVALLCRVLCSQKMKLLKDCMKTHDCSQLYKLLLKCIEDECDSGHTWKHIVEILQLISCSRSGLNELELLYLVPELSWQTWISFRLLLLQYCILVERAGLLTFHNSWVESLVKEILMNEEIERSSTLSIIRYVEKPSSERSLRTALMLPWLLQKVEKAEEIRICLSNPYVFNNLYLSSRAAEMIEYWQHCKEDKQGLLKQYNKMLSSMVNSIDSLSEADIYQSVGRFFRDLGLMEDAVSCLQRSMEIRESELNPDHHLVADSLHYLATVYVRWKKYAMAEPLLKHSLELVECVTGRGHPRVVQELQCLRYVARKQERYEQADSITNRIQSLQDRINGNSSTSNKLSRN